MKGRILVETLERNSRIITAGCILNECLEHTLFTLFNAISETHNVNGHVVFLEFLRQFDHVLLIRTGALQWRSDEDDYSLSQILVLAMLEGELRHGDSCWNVYRARYLLSSGVRRLDDLTELFGVCDQDFWTADVTSYIQEWETQREACICTLSLP